jgi:predicted acetyltransferase
VGRDARQDGAGLRAGDDVDSAAGFARWAGRLAAQADTSRPAGEGRVHASYWWITEDGTYLGAITLRHELNDFLLRAGGHIGYGIRPSARGRGLATWALQSALVRAPALGLRKGSGDLR